MRRSWRRREAARRALALSAWMAAALTFAAPSTVRANAAAPTRYEAFVDGNTVRVCPTNFAARGCPDADGMLREDAATGDAVRLADHCTADAGGATWEDGCYVDECVPPGTWRYGYQSPYGCESASGLVAYHVTATVSDSVEGCQRTAGHDAPTPAGGVPWPPDENEVCFTGSTAGGGACAAAGVAPAGPAAVFGGQLLALLLGAGLWRARRRRERA